MSKPESKDHYKDLAAFYQKKEKEPSGGKNFQVWSKGRLIGTMWARSKQELSNHLNKIRHHFDKLVLLH